MADDLEAGNGSWWDTPRNNSSTPTTLNAIASYGWPSDSATTSTGLQMMGLGLELDWNQALFRDEKGETDLASNIASESSQINRGGFQPHFNSQASSNDSTITSRSFQVDSGAAAYALLLSSENQQHSNYQNPTTSNYPYQPQAGSDHNLHVPPFWNAPAAMTSSFFPPLQNQIPSSLDAKPKAKDQGRELATKNSTNKRARSETPSPFPAFKVRKEKMGDRITALQQLVSPFGKTDTASVLSEAIEYIKFLHEQLTALSAPYMKNGAPMHNQQNNPEKSKDLRSRGLCLVPVSSTFPVTHETSVDFWTPTFGGTFR
ncbi:transcription factor bHLH123-like isoform X3 [Salvia splendens]|uniref:transcription factor bHLH123-like isoform X3 n=1 Tax=Salvia splendens TaxID=180675 RepID=UPI001C260B48|nr:transcription factor bHLH123-like isoform X3 [Salvia splendens]